jgi:hypothetical protein
MISQRANRKTIFVFILVALLSTVVGVVVLNASRKYQAKKPSQQRMLELEDKEKHHRLSLGETAELTKARGKDRATLPAVSVLYPIAPDADTLDQILSKYTIIVAELISQRSYVDQHEKITSWCKFRALDTITQAPPLQSFASRTIPSDLLPIAEDEFLVPREGGVITLDGVQIIQHELTVPEFKASQKYLLLVSFDPVTKIAEMAFGPQSILPIKADRSLDSSQQEHLLQRALTIHHRGSIDQLTRDLKK